MSPTAARIERRRARMRARAVVTERRLQRGRREPGVAATARPAAAARGDG